ncbi:uncharacterized protein LY89DRAFT_683089 [Mollisia scopiformis]|uniref:Uncharacterized protein n=1 Tax=Mollisia scopiformis TaxID=149040 RepID=A0A194XG98_MOLSC|nr:uncharacterized protein LY89DRAFT_683089 [Mollisia scopiformis]KUJ19161.1 hypothetical protein LY89DRAFT_683089 [Mollisia scopiformis]
MVLTRSQRKAALESGSSVTATTDHNDASKPPKSSNVAREEPLAQSDKTTAEDATTPSLNVVLKPAPKKAKPKLRAKTDNEEVPMLVYKVTMDDLMPPPSESVVEIH